MLTPGRAPARHGIDVRAARKLWKNASMTPIAYQGVPGAFSELAARAFAAAGEALLPCESFERLFDVVERGEARALAAPVENSLAGTVRECFDLVASRDVTIAGETLVRVSHALVGAPGATLGGLRRVLSHPVALLQCERFFREHPHLEAVPVFDTAGAAARVVEDGRADQAALASERAALLYGGVVLARALEDHADNFTRFLLVVRREAGAAPPGPGRRKTTLVFRARNQPGALFHCLRPFAERGLNLAKIESRPIKDAPFEYLFHMDVVAEDAGPALDDAVRELAQQCSEVRRLGTYPPAAGTPAG